MVIWLSFFIGCLVCCLAVVLLDEHKRLGKVKKTLLSAAVPLLACIWFLNIGMGEHWRVKAGWITEEWFWADQAHTSLICLSAIAAAELLFWSVYRAILKICSHVAH